MAVRVLSVSYDQSLLVTRQALLERQGYEVVSALGISEAMQGCEAGGVDLFILGHSIPVADKCALIQRFRESSPGRLILSLVRHGDIRIAAADNHVLSENPQDFIEAVRRLVSRSVSA